MSLIELVRVDEKEAEQVVQSAMAARETCRHNRETLEAALTLYRARKGAAIDS